jgi:hypothetical protein
MQKGKQSGYEVRVVDSITAYEWLSPEIVEAIRKAKHNSKIFIHVSELLRLALLIEHGGLSIRPGRILLTENLDWIDSILN